MRNNYLILFLSEYKKTAEEIQYVIPQEDGKVEGSQTNDAPVKYLLLRAAKEGNPINEIICIASDNVRKVKIFENETALSRFEKYITEFNNSIVEQGASDELEIKVIEYAENTDININKMYSELCGMFEGSDECQNVYIDYTGGLRDINFLMIMFVRYFEFNNINCKALVYSNYQKKAICEITNMYSIYQMINGVNQFVSTGNVDELKKVFDQNKHKELEALDKKEHNVANELLDNIILFSNAIKLCDISNIENTAKAMADSLIKIDECEEDDLYVNMLKSLTGTIRKKMYIEKESSIPNIIAWCLDNGLIQQALTLYTEKIPDYLFRCRGMRDFVIKMADLYGYKEPFTIEEIIRNDDEIGGKVTTGAPGFLYNNVFEMVSKNFEAIRLKEQLRKLPSNSEYKTVMEKVTNKNALSNLKAINKLFLQKKYDDLKNEYDINQKEFSKFINTCKSQLGKYHYKLLNLYPDIYEKDFPKNKYESNNSRDITSYKKAKMLERFSERNDVPNSEFMLVALAYYLAVKMLRNRMNHAIENELQENEKEACKIISGIIESEDEKVLEEVLKKPSVDGIGKLIKNALDVMDMQNG